MILAVMALGRKTVHFSPSGDCQTYCKNWATRKAGPIVNASQLCKLCFRPAMLRDLKGTAALLGLERIIENG